MRFFHNSALAVAAMILVSGVDPAHAQDANRAVEGGGISVPGWVGRIDPKEMTAGEKLSNAKLAKEGDALRVTTGPAVAYWNPDNTVSGNYTVKATFKEAKYMNLNTHPHPYGIFIGGNDMGTDRQTYLYCAAYGNGTFIVRGFGPAPFQLGGRRPTAHDAVSKAAGKGSSVTQEIAVTVDADSVDCSINGKVVATYPKAEVVGAGKLKSTDGVYGIRFAHNTDAVVTGLTVTKQ
jgi:hypothetical protein